MRVDFRSSQGGGTTDSSHALTWGQHEDEEDNEAEGNRASDVVLKGSTRLQLNVNCWITDTVVSRGPYPDHVFDTPFISVSLLSVYVFFSAFVNLFLSIVSCLCHCVSVPLSLSLCFWPSVFVNLFLSLSLCHSVSVPLSLSLCFCPSVFVTLFLSLCICHSVSVPLSL